MRCPICLESPIVGCPMWSVGGAEYSTAGKGLQDDDDDEDDVCGPSNVPSLFW